MNEDASVARLNDGAAGEEAGDGSLI